MLGTSQSPIIIALINLKFPSAIPASALYEEDEDEDDEVVGETRDDERTGTRYNVSSHRRMHVSQYSGFSFISILGSMSSLQLQPCTLPCC